MKNEACQHEQRHEEQQDFFIEELDGNVPKAVIGVISGYQEERQAHQGLNGELQRTAQESSKDF